ncbi:MAG: hypothetical protein J3T61_09200, partial [Candidatus Brocadiales bacterium]|nr:hypothetical protein [Candidatus Bathyanammoxibius sp.]
MKRLIILCLVVVGQSLAIGTTAVAQATHENVVLIKAERNVIELSEEVKRIVFDFSGLDDTSFVKEVVLFSGNRIEQAQLPQRDRLARFPSTSFKALLINSKPLYLRRVFDPPFDSLQYDFQGKLVSLPDLSIHYEILLSNRIERDAFAEEVRAMEGILSVDIPPGPDQIQEDGAVPPNDSLYTNQWYLKGGYGTQTEDAWEISSDNTGITIHINEFANGNLSSTAHEDLSANIVYSTFDAPDNSHYISVIGVASAVTNNTIGVAGTAYNSKIRHASWSSLQSAGNHLKTAADNGARVANFSWNTSSDNTQFREAIIYAYNKGVFMVCSGGNTGNRETVRYPGNYDAYVMAIAPLNSSGARPSWATWGPHIDAIAPGVSIYTTTSSESQL